MLRGPAGLQPRENRLEPVLEVLLWVSARQFPGLLDEVRGSIGVGHDGTDEALPLRLRAVDPHRAEPTRGGHGWGNDATPEVPAPTDVSQPKDWFPPAGGFRFALVTVPPDTAASPEDLDMATALVEFREQLPGLAEVMEPDHPGMHTTDTVDVTFIVSGQPTLELDGGARATLSSGDCVVQNGIRHAWRNPASEPCTMAVAIVGARRTSRATTSRPRGSPAPR